MNNENERVISKIRKLLALTKTNFQSEAEAAMLKAQELLMEHNLSMRDIEDTEEGVVVTEEQLEQKNPQWWFFSLAAIIANNFRCNVIRHGFSYSRQKNFRFIGREIDVKIAIEILKFAASLIRYNSKPYQAKSASHANTYIAGFLKGLNDKFDDQVERNQWGLVLVKDKEVIEAAEKYKPKEHKDSGRTSFKKSAAAFNDGYDDGYSFSYQEKRLGEGRI